MFNIKRICAAGALSVLFGSTAWASSGASSGMAITFDNGQYADVLHEKINFYDAASDLGLSITGWSHDAPAALAYKKTGVGVTTGGLDPHDIDSNLLGSDAVVLTFTRAVSLSNLTFTSWDTGLFLPVDQATVSNGSKSIALGNTKNYGSFELADLTGTQFMVQATGWNSSFRLSGVCAQVLSPIPEPATAGLMLLGLVGLGMVVQRHRDRTGSRG